MRVWLTDKVQVCSYMFVGSRWKDDPVLSNFFAVKHKDTVI